MCLEMLTSKSKRVHNFSSLVSVHSIGSVLILLVVVRVYISCGYSCCYYTINVLHFSSVHVPVFFPELD